MKTVSSTVAIRRESIPDLVALYAKAATLVPSSDLLAAAQAAVARRAPQTSRGVALLRLHGVILRRPGLIEEFLGAASLETFMANFRAAVADPEIGTIIISIDSPGGETSGITEAAAEIRAARGSKRIVAVADPMSASAAYWIGAQASEFVASPISIIGAIGVYMVHDDISAALEQEGVKRDIIASSELKASFAPGAPLTDEARAQLEAIVGEQESLFVGDVAKGRGVPVSKVRSGFGKGGILPASTAVDAGMVDRIESLDSVIAKALPRVRTSPAATLDGMVPVAVIEPPEDPPVPAPDPDPPEPDDARDVPDTAAELELLRYRHRAHVR